MSQRYNGYVLPPDETIQGSPRFSWSMVAMMLHVYRATHRVTAPNGCKPSWVHMASERDGPVVACPVVHLELAVHPSIDRVNWDGIEHSQWVTLWVPHAHQIAGTVAYEAELKAYWEPRFANQAQDVRVTMPSGDQWSHSAPDEVVIGWELTRRPDGPRARTGAGLTYFSWQSAYCRTVDNSNAGERTSPCAYVTREAATAACGYAREHGRYFARKIGDGSVASSLQVIGALADCIGFHLLPPPSISPPPSPLPITPPLPWPPTMPLPWPPPMPPPMPPPHRLPSPPLPSEPTLRREQPPQLPTALHNSDGFWYFACFVLAAGLVFAFPFAVEP